MEVAPQRRGDQAGSAVADRAAIDPHHRKDDLARGRDESLPRFLGFFHRETAFFQSYSLDLQHLQNDGAGDALEDGVRLAAAAR